MTIQECYEQIGGDYEDVLKRLFKGDLVAKFLLKFPNDPSYEDLIDAMEKEDVDRAFRASHTIKGLCANLGLSRLGKSSSQMCEFLRAKDFDSAKAIQDTVVEDYKVTLDGIKEFEATR